MRDIYITRSGVLRRKENSLEFEDNEGKKSKIPVKDISSIYSMSEVSINNRLMEFLSKLSIPIYYFNHYGFYIGMFAPRKQNNSGKLIIEQVLAYNSEKRLTIAKEFLFGAIHNMRKTLMQYNLEFPRYNIHKEKIERSKDIGSLLGIEANIRQIYYSKFNDILKNKDFEFIKRVRNPPDNYINTLISFGNSLLYTTTLSEIYKTQLLPEISYLHEPSERRYSLNLDIAEIFKPLIVDRVIFTLVNKKIITPDDFNRKLNFCFLNESGRRKFLQEYDKKLTTTLRYPKLNRNVSYRYMLRLEAYKLIKYLLEGKEYNSFKIYW